MISMSLDVILRRIAVSMITIVTIFLLAVSLDKARGKFYRSPAGIYILKRLQQTKYVSEIFLPKTIKKEYVLAFYQLMKDIHDTLEYNNIKYWIDSGTLLGAVRHGGMIPWDDDLDIAISEQHYNDFVNKTCPILQKLGYKINEFRKAVNKYRHIKIIVPTVLLPSKEKNHRIFCDIFFTIEKNNQVYTSPWWPAIDITDLKPLKKDYKFGSLLLWGPNNPFPYIKRSCGSNWQNIGYTESNHIESTYNYSKNFFALTEDLLKPAMPIGPLQERVKNLLNSLDNINNLPACHFVPLAPY